MNDYLIKVFDSANEGIYVTDSDRRFLLWNEAAARLSGYDKKEIIGRSCYDNILQHVDREGRPLCQGKCPLQAAIEDGIPRGPEIVFLRHKSGKRIAVEVNTAAIRNDAGDIIGGVEVFRDITERLENERLLQERKKNLETVLDNIGEGILFLDKEGNISMINLAFGKIFAPTLAEDAPSSGSVSDNVLAHRAMSAIEELYRRSADPAWDKQDERCPEGRGLFRCWTAVLDKSPVAPRARCFECAVYRTCRMFLEKPRELIISNRSISVVSSFLEFPDSNELREIIVCRDVTADKLDAALKVAGAAAHELRQPLQVIIITAELLKKEMRRNKSIRKNIDTLLTSCERMDDIIRKMTAMTEYRTKEYIGGHTILDISRSQGNR